MSMYSALVSFDWKKLERQPLYVKSARSNNEKRKYRIELTVDRSGDEDLRGSSFYVYGEGIDDIPLNTDVIIKIDSEHSMFMRDSFGFNEYIVVDSCIAKKSSGVGDYDN